MHENPSPPLSPALDQSWKELLQKEFGASYFLKLKEFLLEEKTKAVIYPPGRFIFNAFNLTPAGKVKVVILGQDPYHGAGQAHGLCFSVPDGIALPPSLRNIFKELNDDLGFPVAQNGNLEKWARQGVLLLNATLTVRANQAGSHQNRGWEEFTGSAVSALSQKYSDIVFLLWGRYAQAKEPLIDSRKHLILKAAHPSPFSAFSGFFGCRHFSRANAYLLSRGKEPVDWKLQ